MSSRANDDKNENENNEDFDFPGDFDNDEKDFDDPLSRRDHSYDILEEEDYEYNDDDDDGGDGLEGISDMNITPNELPPFEEIQQGLNFRPFSYLCAAPFERISILLQTQHSHVRFLKKLFLPYTGVLNCMRRLRKDQGIRSFWKGLIPGLVSGFLTSDVFPFVHGSMMTATLPFISPSVNPITEQEEYEKKSHFTWEAMFLSSTVIASSFLIAAMAHPFEYARLRLAADPGPREINEKYPVFKGTFNCLLQTWRAQGLRHGVYRGYLATTTHLGVLVFSGILGDFLTKLYVLGRKIRRKSPSNMTMFALIQGIFLTSTTLTYPILTIRNRIQLMADKPVHECLYKGYWHCLDLMLKNEGKLSLFKGYSAFLMKNAVMFLILGTVPSFIINII